MNVFPQLPGQAFIVSKAPSWSTTVKKAASGRQVRASQQAAPIWKFKLSYEVIRDRTPSASELQALWAFFNAAQGQLNAWYFLDPGDNLVVDQEVGVGDGATTSFQLSRTVGAATAYPFVEPVYGVNGRPSVYLSNAATAGFTVGPYGTVTFASPPPAGSVISWSGSFYFLCHFTQDDLQAAQITKSLWSQDGLQFESLLP